MKVSNEFKTYSGEIVHIDKDRQYVLSLREIEDPEEFIKYWWQVTSQEGDMFNVEMRKYTYQPNPKYVIEGIETLYMQREKDAVK